jgi:hypothetical protein
VGRELEREGRERGEKHEKDALFTQLGLWVTVETPQEKEIQNLQRE